MKAPRALLAIALSQVFSPCLVRAQESSSAFRTWVAAHSSPVITAKADTSTRDLRRLSAAIGGARVVAYGEPTHGMHEPLALRNRLFRFLVERMGFTAIAIESGFTESEAIERYVAGGAGNLRDVVRSNFSWGFGEFQENAELIKWMRSYNMDPAHPRKLHFYGIDLSGAGNGAFPDARRPVDAALAHLQTRAPGTADSLRVSFNPLLDRFSSDRYSTLRPNEREQLRAALKKLGVALAQGRSTSESADDADAWASQNVKVAEQLNEMLQSYPPPGPNPGIPPEAFRSAAARDSGMAANVMWALRREGADGRLLVFAHNNHVMNSTVTGGPWSAYRVPPPAMGKFLRSELGDRLVIIGSAIGTAARERANPPKRERLDDLLSNVSASSFAIDLRSTRADPHVWNWLSKPRVLSANITDYVIIRPIPAFDIIIHIRSLTPSTTATP